MAMPRGNRTMNVRVVYRFQALPISCGRDLSCAQIFIQVEISKKR